MTRIVVGVDGSEHSRRALVRAIDEAELRDGTVEAIYAYPPHHSSIAGDIVSLSRGAASPIRTVSTDRGENAPSPARVAQQHAERQLEDFVDEALEGLDVTRPQLVATPSEHPAAALIDAARTADLLVIGTRGLGGLSGMLLGSVAHQCIQRCLCPMLVLPPEED